MQVLEFSGGLSWRAMCASLSLLSQIAFKTLVFTFVYENLEDYFEGPRTVCQQVDSSSF